MSLYLSLYLARGGVCARRKAIELIKEGEVSVNGTYINDPAHKVEEHDKVMCFGRRVIIAKPVYVLFNKPKGLVTSCSDERNRRTVVDMIKIKPKNVRLYPVGRLDKDTTGALILTNDGEWAQKLAHPKYRVAKTYVATLDKEIDHKVFEQLKHGVHLPDGKFVADRVYYPSKNNKRVIGLTIHSGKYRIIRRVFYRMGFDVKKLDRLFYGSLTLKNLPRGSWRLLSAKEIEQLIDPNAKSSVQDRSKWAKKKVLPRRSAKPVVKSQSAEEKTIKK